MADRVTDAYIQRCLEGDRRLLDAVSEASALFPEAFHATSEKRLLPRPIFIADVEIRGFAAELISLIDLLATVPERMFDNDLGRFCEALGIDERCAKVIRRFPSRPTLYGRPDLYHDGTSFKLLELNIGSEIGGTEFAEISRALLEVEAFRAFADEHRLSYIHTGRQIAKALSDAAAPLTGGAAPVVAIVDSDYSQEEYVLYVLPFQEMMRPFGIEVLLSYDVGEFRRHGGRWYLRDRRIDVVLRFYTAEEIVADPHCERAFEVIFRAHEDGEIILWTTLQSALYANKSCLALLSDGRSRGVFTPEETALIDRVLPWTRMLACGQVEAEGQTVDLIEYCRDRREELILKPTANYGGSGIVVGWETTDGEWKETLMSCCEQGYVVQRRVVPRREPLINPMTGTVEHWSAVWGVYLTPDGYAGSNVRAMPSDEGAVIGMGANPCCRVAAVFTYPAEETEPVNPPRGDAVDLRTSLQCP